MSSNAALKGFRFTVFSAPVLSILPGRTLKKLPMKLQVFESEMYRKKGCWIENSLQTQTYTAIMILAYLSRGYAAENVPDGVNYGNKYK